MDSLHVRLCCPLGQELAAARAAANDARRTCIEDRLREAVARRASRLEMVKERAALFAGIRWYKKGHDCWSGMTKRGLACWGSEKAQPAPLAGQGVGGSRSFT
eukprot:1146067-Pelagomonas_calceolata.AAC.1